MRDVWSLFASEKVLTMSPEWTLHGMAHPERFELPINWFDDANWKFNWINALQPAYRGKYAYR